MPDTFTEVTSQSWLSRIGNSIKGIIFGLLLIVGAVILLWWNEGRAVKTATSLQEGAAAAVNIAAGAVVPGNDGKLVHLSGEVMAAEPVRDTVFGVRAKAIRLSRKVEMFQWKEERKSETRSRSDGGTEKRPTFSYVKIWSGELIKSVDFEHPDEHKNPAAMLAGAATAVADHATLGSFRLPPSIIAKMKGDEALAIGIHDFAKAHEGMHLVPLAADRAGHDLDAMHVGIGFQPSVITEIGGCVDSVFDNCKVAGMQPRVVRAGNAFDVIKPLGFSAGARHHFTGARVVPPEGGCFPEQQRIQRAQPGERQRVDSPPAHQARTVHPERVLAARVISDPFVAHQRANRLHP